jgi:hypothetical protein
MKEHTKKHSEGAAGHREEEVRYLADKMGVSVDEMRRLLADSSINADELEHELLKSKPVET